MAFALRARAGSLSIPPTKPNVAHLRAPLPLARFALMALSRVADNVRLVMERANRARRGLPTIASSANKAP